MIGVIRNARRIMIIRSIRSSMVIRGITLLVVILEIFGDDWNQGDQGCQAY